MSIRSAAWCCRYSGRGANHGDDRRIRLSVWLGQAGAGEPDAAAAERAAPSQAVDGGGCGGRAALNFALACSAAIALDQSGDDFLTYFIIINLTLGLFNLLPVPPMDGGRIAVGVLPLPAARWLARSEKAGIILVLLLLFVLPTVLGTVWRDGSTRSRRRWRACCPGR